MKKFKCPGRAVINKYPDSGMKQEMLREVSICEKLFGSPRQGLKRKILTCSSCVGMSFEEIIEYQKHEIERDDINE